MQTKNAGVALLLLAALATGCAKTNDSSTDNLDGGGDGGLGSSKAGAYSLFDPTAASPVIPFPNDVLFAGFTQPTLNIPNAANIPFVTAANLQDGFATSASLFTDFIGFIDYNSVLDCNTFPASTPAILVLDTSGPAPLTPCVDYTIQISTVIDNTGAPINLYRSRVLIEPLKPFKPSTRYIVALTDAPVSNLFGVPGFNLGAVTSTDGVAATPADVFEVVKSTTPVASQTAPVLTTLTDGQKAILEELRVQAVQPVVAGLCVTAPPACAAGIPASSILIAWSFTTESTSTTLTKLNTAATAQPIFAASTTISTGDLGLGLADTADIYAGTLKVPYYLANTSRHETDPLNRFWLADTSPGATDFAATFLGQVPCGAFFTHATLPNGITVQPSVSTTLCFPRPVKRSDETIPLMLAVPNANSGQSIPVNGWPVVIFQHGITGNRTQMLAIAPTLAAAGFATIGIDLPLHGLTDPTLNLATNPFYQNQIFLNPAFGGAFNSLLTGERTFNLDLENNGSGVPIPDGTIDGSGTWFINLPNLTVSRDNLRQAVADLITLTKSVGGLTGANALLGQKLDATRIYFVGHSLGGIVGTTLLGVNTDIRAGALAMPGGGLAGLLDSSHTFGPIVSGGLAAEGVAEGTDDYESFLRFAQTLTDPGDPINYAAAANTNHSILMLEVIGDTVVPNSGLALAAASATQDKTPLSRYLSGTDPLAAVMGLATTTITAPVLVATPTAPDMLVKFTAGTHGSILTPAGPGGATQFLAVTCEMQREVATFLFNDGAGFLIGSPTCP